MSETDRWLTDYGESHRDISNPGIYWPASLVLVLGVVGLLWSLPVPQEFFDISPVFNWGTAFLMAAVVYYFIISISLAIGMLPFIFGITAAQIWLTDSDWSHPAVSSALVIVGVLGLIAGQIPNGSAQQVARDIQLMMIAPVWMLSNLYRRLGIPY